MAALFHDLLTKTRTTTSLAFSDGLRLATAAAAGSISLVYPDVNGALLGVGAWILSYVTESAMSGWRLARLGWYVETRA